MDEKDSVINMQKLELDSLRKDYKHLVTMHRELKDARKGNSVTVQTEKVADYSYRFSNSYIAIYVCMDLTKVAFHTHNSKTHSL